MSDLFNLYVEAGSPNGDDQPQSAHRWAAEEITTLRQQLEQAQEENESFREKLHVSEARVAELESVCLAVVSDLRDRARTDSDGCKVVNLSNGVWFRLRQQADEAEKNE